MTIVGDDLYVVIYDLLCSVNVILILQSALWIGPPVLNSERRNISLCDGDSNTFNFTVDVGNPRSTMTITGPSQPGNPRVSISSEGVVNISRAIINDTGTHIATWRNDAESATFTLDLNVTRKSLHNLLGLWL